MTLDANAIDARASEMIPDTSRPNARVYGVLCVRQGPVVRNSTHGI